MHELIIDCLTDGYLGGLEAIERLDGTVSVTGPHIYMFDGSYCQLRYCGTMTEEEMYEWLYDNHIPGFDWVGVVGADEPEVSS